MRVAARESATIANAKQQIASAVSAAPEDRREQATVLGYDGDGALVELRHGSNEIICIADNPKDERFQVACYHESLEPFMVRGRELRAQGLGSTENMSARHAEADEGRLELPKSPAALYNLGGPLDIYDPETGAVNGGYWVWSIYTPYATEISSGLPTTPQAPGAPWIMRPGTASSHIMIVQPREPKPGSD
ncbi:MAG: hypothetical protein IH936_09450 [Acidobacteria bacterium]|nr:hypothetical protein [Acidobacteriota bacterium]